MQKFILEDAKLSCYYPNTLYLNKSAELGKSFAPLFDVLDIKIPSSIYTNLSDAGILPRDINFEMNSLECEWVTNRWWFYQIEFDSDLLNDERADLVFEGIDYKANIYINDQFLTTSENMFCETRIDITDKIKYTTKNNIKVILESPPGEMSQVGYTYKVDSQKSRFNYKWDFCPRLVDMGITKPVYIQTYPGIRISSHYFEVIGDAREGKAVLHLDIDSNAERFYDVTITMFDEHDNNQVIHVTCSGFLNAGENTIAIPVCIDQVKLWWCNGYGDPDLYTLSVVLTNRNAEDAVETDVKIVDQIHARVGFKTIELVANEHTELHQDALNYTFLLNGTKIYIKGYNVTPTECLLGEIKSDKVKYSLELLRNSHANLVRVWGGGVIESEEFYEFCDEFGILVWQEFIQSGSGLSSYPNEDDAFLDNIRKTAISAVKEKRNHVSLAVFSGGNELRDRSDNPITMDNKNIQTIKSVVDKFAPHIPMLPSSASGPSEFGVPTEKGINHDIHGPWQYLGNLDQYYYANEIDSLFHSEFGCAGMCDRHSLKKFLSDKNIDVFDMKDNYVWRHHGDWWNTYDRDTEIFGEIKDVETFSKLSQFMQSEAIRYMIEANRRRAFQNSGSIIWQLNEPYPNVSCTSVLDYYNVPKLAYWRVAKAFQRINPNLQYSKLVYNAKDTFEGSFFVTSDVNAGQCRVKLTVSIDDKDGGRLEWLTIDKTVDIVHGTVLIDHISFDVPEASSMLFEASVSVIDNLYEDKRYENSVLLLIKQSDGYCSQSEAVQYYHANYSCR